MKEKQIFLVKPDEKLAKLQCLQPHWLPLYHIQISPHLSNTLEQPEVSEDFSSSSIQIYKVIVI